MAGFDVAVHQCRRNREVDTGLTDVVGGIGDELGPAFVELLQARPRTDSDPVAAGLADRLDDELGEAVEGVAQGLRLAADVGFDVGQDRILVEDDRVFMRTTGGLSRVDVIYRRINDDYLDPKAFITDSMLGVPGLMRAYSAGNVALANAVGTGVADDKAVYAYMPRIIRYYLTEEPILNNVETHICREPEALRYTLDHLAELVVKPVGEAGGYGITVGPKATRQELDECRAKLLANPSNYISQPCIKLSVAPTLVDGHVEPRHVDLRPFAITGSSTWVLPGGLTRVALRRGSLVVNSSQGGGSKDTWVVE